VHFGIGSRKAKKERGSKDQVGEGRIKQLQHDSLQVSICMCIFLAIFGIPVVVFCYGMGFSRCDSVFSLALPFPYSLDEIGSHTSVELYYRMDSKLSGVDL